MTLVVGPVVWVTSWLTGWMCVVTLGVGTVSYLLYTILSTSGSEYQDNSIDAFIIMDNGDSESKKPDIVVKSKGDHYHPTYNTEGRQLLIIYGTEYGFSEEVAFKLFDRINAIVQSEDVAPLQPRLVNTKDHRYVDWSREQVCFVVIATSGDGVPPTDARGFYDDLMSRDCALGHLRYSVLGLGDSNYPHFCKTGRDVDVRFSKLCADPVVKCQDVDMEDWSVIARWMDSVVDYLGSCDIDVCDDYLLITGDEEGHNRHQPFMATLKVKELLTKVRQPGDKETIHCEFDIAGSNLSWTSGDALGIYPENNPDHVDAILDTISWSELETFPTPSWAYYPHNELENLRTLLVKYYDIKTVKVELLQQQLTTVTSGEQSAMLSWLLQGGTGKSNLPLQEYIAAHEVRDTLREFESAMLLPRQLLLCLRPLQPRYYSISSSPLKNESTVCVTAAIVRYRTLSGDGEGVTTTYLQDRARVGEACHVFMSRNPDFRLPVSHSTPVILIGPGTGIAPFRAFIQEREHDPYRGETHLYFGCRHRDQDFLYQDKLEKYNNLGIVQLRVAFSRDQEEKIYVQDLLMEDLWQIWDLVSKRTGHVYVCGDARHMAKDVHQALTNIVQTCGQLDGQAAVEYLRQLEVQGRYQKDVWVT